MFCDVLQNRDELVSIIQKLNRSDCAVTDSNFWSSQGGSQSSYYSCVRVRIANRMSLQHLSNYEERPAGEDWVWGVYLC